LRLNQAGRAITIATPVLPHGTSEPEAIGAQRGLVDALLASESYGRLVTWYYTPMALRFSDHIGSDVCVYDCMDELSAFKNAPTELVRLEKVMFDRADVVFTGGQSLYEAKRAHHRAIYPFPSSIDVAHFHQARQSIADPADQAHVPHPRVGFFGVIDERLDIDLVAYSAEAMPDVQFMMIGPVVKIDPATLPQHPNIHWLGGKQYAELPSYLANWDAGWMPFALNESTRYISPTKTPEFLAAGLPVVSTAIVDVVRTYGAEGLVSIVDADDIVEKLRDTLSRPREHNWAKTDAFLAGTSWDRTWEGMAARLATASALTSVIPLRRGA
jgi:glycosyltransferase involved in cell wall biosynthesis